MLHDKLYIAVLETVPDHMVPVLVAHATLGAHMRFYGDPNYDNWLMNSFRKCVIRVNEKEFLKIRDLDQVYRGHENSVLGGTVSCLAVCPSYQETPNVLKFAKLWKPLKIPTCTLVKNAV